MGFGFRKSINLGGGVRLNFSKRGVGMSVGGKGWRVGVGPSGTRMRATVPGTGVYYEKRFSSKTPRAARTHYAEINQADRNFDRSEALERNRLEVDAFNRYVAMLTSVHEETSESVDWEAIAAEEPPFSENEIGPNERAAREALYAYRPGVFDRLLRRAEKIKAQLQQAVADARKEDERLLQSWRTRVETAKRVLAGDIQTYQTVLSSESPFDDIEALGSGVQVRFPDGQTAIADFAVRSEAVIPDKRKTLTATGRVSERKMSKTDYYGLYQDYVCSCLLRIGRELFALLPVDIVFVNARASLLNTATGHLEEGVIVSVRFDRVSFEKIKFDRIDCSDAVGAFPNRQHFRKTKGYDFVEPLIEL